MAMRLSVSRQLANGMVTLHCVGAMRAVRGPQGREPVQKQAQNEKKVERRPTHCLGACTPRQQVATTAKL